LESAHGVGNREVKGDYPTTTKRRRRSAGPKGEKAVQKGLYSVSVEEMQTLNNIGDSLWPAKVRDLPNS